jgi:hypothetical protein
MFDPSQFLDMQMTEANDTKVIPCPVGEYLAVVDKVEFRPWQKKDDPSVNGVSLDVSWAIQDHNVQQLLGRDKVLVRQGVGIDFTDAGGLDMGRGRNIGLGRLREAVGLNIPGRPFSPNMLPGQMAKVNVSHRVVGEDIFSEIKAVTKPT